MSHGNIRLPGFVDIHIHGCGGHDTSDGDPAGIIGMARTLRDCAVGAFVPTTMTISREEIYRVFEAVSVSKELAECDPSCAKVLGVRLEGPFINPFMAGVQDVNCCMAPYDGIDMINDLEDRYPGLLKIIDLSPELPGSDIFLSEFSERYLISLAHSNADMKTASEAFDQGARGVTHMLNAMEPCLKRSPGIPGAAFTHEDVSCELICDGYHIDPVVLKMLFKTYGADRIICISDSMRGAGMPDGVYKLGPVDVTVRNGRTFYGEHGGLAGSVSDLASEAKVLYGLGISPEDISAVMTDNPLSRLGLKGKIDTGTAVFDNRMDFVGFE